MNDASADQLLVRYLAASAEPETEILLARILDETAKPIITRVVAAVFRNSTPTDVEDLVSETITHLLRRLRSLKSADASPIRDLGGYIAICAHNTCHEQLRRRYPARNRLRNQVRYLLQHHPHFTLWRADDSRMLCGRREWVDRPPASSERIEGLTPPVRIDPAAEDRAQIVHLVSAILDRADAPVEMDDLIDVIARRIHADQRRVDVPLETAPHHDTRHAAVDSDLRLSLRVVWLDIRELSPRQRTALLLNLRDVDGSEILSLLTHTRIATTAEIAQALGMPLDQLAGLWNDLPLNDDTIGRLLGATRQQVIKLRRLARERLRRMAQRRERTDTAAGSGVVAESIERRSTR